jgi:hypothetical protein
MNDAYLAVGAPYSASAKGFVEMFAYSSANNNYATSAVKEASDGANGDNFGQSLALSPGYMLVGSQLSLFDGQKQPVPLSALHGGLSPLTSHLSVISYLFDL